MKKHDPSVIDVTLLMVSGMALTITRDLDTFPKAFVYTVIGIGIVSRIIYLVINRKKN